MKGFAQNYTKQQANWNHNKNTIYRYFNTNITQSRLERWKVKCDKPESKIDYHMEIILLFLKLSIAITSNQ